MSEEIAEIFKSMGDSDLIVIAEGSPSEFSVQKEE
jgi:hypothetical protein